MSEFEKDIYQKALEKIGKEFPSVKGIESIRVPHCGAPSCFCTGRCKKINDELKKQTKGKENGKH
jgi:hypothetical protein